MAFIYDSYTFAHESNSAKSQKPLTAGIAEKKKRATASKIDNYKLFQKLLNKWQEIGSTMINILDKKRVENYYYSYLTEKERLDIELIRCAVNKVIDVNANLVQEKIKKLSEVDHFNLIQESTNVIDAIINEFDTGVIFKIVHLNIALLDTDIKNKITLLINARAIEL